MATESRFVGVALRVAEKVAPARCEVVRGEALLYQVAIDNHLELTVDVKAPPKRGQSAFQTDLCVFEKRRGLRIPRVVLEFKTRITTHDVLTYSAKARKHKQVYPYLRYGVVISEEAHIPGRVFTHNEALDFAVAAGGLKAAAFERLLGSLLRAELRASRRLEAVAFGESRIRVFRSEVRTAQTNDLRSRLGR